jgi:hypothetical protein
MTEPRSRGAAIPGASGDFSLAVIAAFEAQKLHGHKQVALVERILEAVLPFRRISNK